MTKLSRMIVASGSALCLAGCATGDAPLASAVVSRVEAKAIEADRIKEAIAIGKSTKADVIAKLGETLAITFDSGYEVWVYRLRDDYRASAPRVAFARSSKAWPRTPAEFVILFSPGGVVTKTRTRPAS